jgi:hypothetical protein
MTPTEILKRLAALSKPENDDMQWLTALATDVKERGIVGDEDVSATIEACNETRRVALEIRDLATAARMALEV